MGCTTAAQVLLTCFPDPPAPFTLSSQEEVNEFPSVYPLTTQLDVDITISGADIVDLSPLLQITTVTQTITVFDNPNLVSMSGLGSVELSGTTAGVLISNNPLLEEINPYTQSNDQIEGVSIWDCPSIVDLEAFSAITNIDSMLLYRNSELQTLSGLENITTVNFIGVNQNDNLLNLNGFSGVTGTLEELAVFSNPLLVNLNGLEGIQTIAVFGMSITNNESLSSLSGLENVTYIEGMELLNND